MNIAYRLIESEDEDTRITIIVTSRTLPRVREVIDSLKEFISKRDRSGIVDFDYLLVDFTDMVSILGAAYEVLKKYHQLDYFFANSAQGVYDGIDWIGAVREICANPIKGATDPHYKIQRIGVMSQDGMGLVFQCNVFGPYYLLQKLTPLLEAAKGRVIWISSIMSDPKYLSFDDLELLKSDSSYEGSKREIDLLHIATYEQLREKGITQYLIHPGIFTSMSFFKFLNLFTYYGMLLMFYVVRLLGSPWMNISGYSAANAPVYAAKYANKNFEKQDVKYGSASTRDGHEYIKIEEVDKTGADDLLHYLEKLKKEWDDKLENQITNSRQR
jgi:3-keto steroid reductase